MRSLRMGAVAASLWLTIIHHTLAMQFQVDLLNPPDTAIVQGDGEIITGDYDRLLAALGSLPSGIKFGLALDSPGGNLLEAERMANFIHSRGFLVIVTSNSRCVSACFLLFAAGEHRLIGSNALIGVHSASTASGQENATTMAVTTMMARDAAALGVPDAIVGKMVETTPNGVNWLTHNDLRTMGVMIFSPQTGQPSSPASAPAANYTPPSSAPPSAAFQDGLAQRRRWESWFGGLSGDYRDGASFWSAHRSDHNPPECAVQKGKSRQWIDGCRGAQQQLAYPDARRKTDQDFRQGWNSF